MNPFKESCESSVILLNNAWGARSLSLLIIKVDIHSFIQECPHRYHNRESPVLTDNDRSYSRRSLFYFAEFQTFHSPPAPVRDKILGRFSHRLFYCLPLLCDIALATLLSFCFASMRRLLVASLSAEQLCAHNHMPPGWNSSGRRKTWHFVEKLEFGGYNFILNTVKRAKFLEALQIPWKGIWRII